MNVALDKKALMKFGQLWPVEKLAASAPSKGLGKGLAAAVVVELDPELGGSVTFETSTTTSVVVVVGASFGAASRRRSSRCSSSDMMRQWPSTKTGIRVSISKSSGSAFVSVSVPDRVGRRSSSGEMEAATAQMLRHVQQETSRKIIALNRLLDLLGLEAHAGPVTRARLGGSRQLLQRPSGVAPASISIAIFIAVAVAVAAVVVVVAAAAADTGPRLPG